MFDLLINKKNISTLLFSSLLAVTFVIIGTNLPAQASGLKGKSRRLKEYDKGPEIVEKIHNRKKKEKLKEKYKNFKKRAKNEKKVGKKHPKPTEPVPEPLTILGSAMALGFGGYFKKQYTKKRKAKG